MVGSGSGPLRLAIGGVVERNEKISFASFVLEGSSLFTALYAYLFFLFRRASYGLVSSERQAHHDTALTWCPST